VTFCHRLKLESPDGCIKDMRRQDPEYGKGCGQIVPPLVVETEDEIELSTICRQLKMKAPDGKMRLTDCANTEDTD
jgi:predicted NUDIX family phosphoesterase